MRSALAFAAALAAALPAAAGLGAASAFAAPPWAASVPITEAGRSASDPLPVTSADGTTAIFYRRDGGGVPGGVCSFVSRARGATAFGTPHLLHGGCAGAVTYAQRSVAALTLTSTPRGNTYSVAFGTTRGSFGRAKRLVTGRQVRRGSLAGNADGTLAFAYFEDRGTTTDEIYVRLRRAGGSFGSPIRLARDRVRNVAAAVGRRGEILVAWEARGRIRVRIRRAAARGFGATQTLRSEPTYNADLQAAFAQNGRAMLAWSAKFLSEGGDQGPKLNQVAVRPAGAARFRPAQLLERDPNGRIDLGNLRLDASGAGPPVVAWTGREGARAVVRVTQADARGVFGAPATVSPAAEDSHLTTLARAAQGTLAVLWSRDLDAPSQIFAAVRPVGAAAFGAPETLSAGEDARAGRLTFGAAGRLTAVWQDISGVGDDRVLRVFAADRAP